MADYRGRSLTTPTLQEIVEDIALPAAERAHPPLRHLSRDPEVLSGQDADVPLSKHSPYPYSEISVAPQEIAAMPNYEGVVCLTKTKSLDEPSKDTFFADTARISERNWTSSSVSPDLRYAGSNNGSIPLRTQSTGEEQQRQSKRRSFPRDAIQRRAISRPIQPRHVIGRRVARFDGLECSLDSEPPKVTAIEAAANRKYRFEMRRKQKRKQWRSVDTGDSASYNFVDQPPVSALVPPVKAPGHATNISGPYNAIWSSLVEAYFGDLDTNKNIVEQEMTTPAATILESLWRENLAYRRHASPAALQFDESQVSNNELLNCIDVAAQLTSIARTHHEPSISERSGSAGTHKHEMCQQAFKREHSNYQHESNNHS